LTVNPESANYFERLGLDPDAGEAEIKRAFAKAVRAFPPEKEAEKYALLREAYDTLSNENARSEYKTRLQFGSEMKNLETKLAELDIETSGEEYQRTLKKLINLAPSMATYRNLYGIVLLKAGQTGAARKQFVKAVKMDPYNKTYKLNYGNCLQEDGEHEKAIDALKEAWELDPEDYEAPRALARLYFFHLDRKEEAYQVLDQAVYADGKIDFQDFFCLYDKFFMLMVDNKENELDELAKQISSIAEDEDERAFAGFIFFKAACDVYSGDNYQLAMKLSKVAQDICPDEKDYRKFYVEVKKQNFILKSAHELLEDWRVYDVIKEAVRIRIASYFAFEEKNVIEERESQLIRVISTMANNPDNVLKLRQSLSIIREKYSMCYELVEGYEKALSICPPVSPGIYPCPWCNKEVDFLKTTWPGTYTCPHCSQKISLSRQRGIQQYNDTSDCFVATVAYGSPMADDLHILRWFRDDYLIPNVVGKKLVSVYYLIGPMLASWISKSDTKRDWLRNWVLKPVVKSIRLRLFLPSQFKEHLEGDWHGGTKYLKDYAPTVRS